MSGWTDELIDERNRKQASQGFLGGLSGMIQPTPIVQHVFVPVGGDFPLTCKLCACYKDSVNHVQPREGRVKGIAAEAERTCNGRVYHSKAEAVKALELYLAQKAGAFRRVTPQVPYPIVVNAVRICNVVVDFEIEHNDGTIEAIEVKGHETDLYKLKAKLLRACYPKLRYTVVEV